MTPIHIAPRTLLLALAGALATIVLAVPALAQATGTSGYSQTPPPPTTTTTTTTTPHSGTAPSKESAPSEPTPKPKTSTTPTTHPTEAPGHSTLPFTGLDLRWVIASGVLLLGAGLSLRFRGSSRGI